MNEYIEAIDKVRGILRKGKYRYSILEMNMVRRKFEELVTEKCVNCVANLEHCKGCEFEGIVKRGV